MYKLFCNDTNIKDLYVGYTTDFIKMISRHKSKCNTPNNPKYNYKVYKTIRDNVGFNNWSFIELEKYPCDSIKEANTRLHYWIEQLNATLNSTNLVKQTEEEKKEYHKKYRESMKQKLIELIETDKINMDKVRKQKERRKLTDKIRYEKNKVKYTMR